jgi:3',5'-cyclic AMP phosphodiesterase CpdA
MFFGRSPAIHRREFMLGGAAALAATPSGDAMNAMNRRQLSGTVYDASGNSQHAHGGRGIANVLVSNGREVTRTRDDGSWTLPFRSGYSPFVIKPPHWSTPHQGGLPRFFAARREFSTTSEDIHFALTRTWEPDEFEVALVADTQPANEAELGFVARSLLAPLAASDASLVIHHGDVVGDNPDLLSRYAQMLAATGRPWHHCAGNHDMDPFRYDGKRFETWVNTFGPASYAFQVARATFIVLNNVAPVTGAIAKRIDRDYVGQIGEQQLAFVSNLLRYVDQDDLVVVSMHIPLRSFEDPRHPSDNTIDADELLALLSRHPHSISFAGHSHTTEHHYLGAMNGRAPRGQHHHHVLTAACANWWSGPLDECGIPGADSRDGTPRGFHALSIRGNNCDTRFVSTRESETRPVRVMLGSGDGTLLAHAFSPNGPGATHLLINVFDGGPRTSVDVSIGDGCLWRQAVLEPRYDPSVRAYLAANEAACKPWAYASLSSHIWACELPESLSAGCHLISVRVRDEFGREHFEKTMIERSI